MGEKLEEFLRQKEESMCEVGKVSCSSENLFTIVEGRTCRGLSKCWWLLVTVCPVVRTWGFLNAVGSHQRTLARQGGCCVESSAGPGLGVAV